MEKVKARPGSGWSRWPSFLVPLAVLVIVMVLGILAYRAFAKPQIPLLLAGKELVSPSVLEERAGFRVTLIAVTAAGGMVDLRFKITDVEKATKVLQDSKLVPYLVVAESNASLKPGPETLQGAKLENGIVYYILYGNTGDLVKPGTPVSVVVGDWVLEPMAAK